MVYPVNCISGLGHIIWQGFSDYCIVFLKNSFSGQIELEYNKESVDLATPPRREDFWHKACLQGFPLKISKWKVLIHSGISKESMVALNNYR